MINKWLKAKVLKNIDSFASEDMERIKLYASGTRSSRKLQR